MKFKRLEPVLMIGVGLLASLVLANLFFMPENLTEEKRIYADSQGIANQLGAQAIRLRNLKQALKDLPAGHGVPGAIQKSIAESKKQTDEVMAKSRPELDALQARLDSLSAGGRSKVPETFISLTKHWLDGGLESMYAEVEEELRRARAPAESK